MKKEKPKEQPKQGVSLEKILLDLDSRLNEQATQLKQTQEQFGQVAKTLSVQLTESKQVAPVVQQQNLPADPRSQSELNKPLTQGDLLQIGRDIIQIYNQTRQAPDPRVEQFAALQDRVVQVLFEKMARQLTGDLPQSKSDAGVG